MRVLVVNAGSSTLKLTLLDADDGVLEERELASPHRGWIARAALRRSRSKLKDADAIGHRIVHGGERFHAAGADRRRRGGRLRS